MRCPATTSIVKRNISIYAFPWRCSIRARPVFVDQAGKSGRSASLSPHSHHKGRIARAKSTKFATRGWPATFRAQLFLLSTPRLCARLWRLREFSRSRGWHVNVTSQLHPFIKVERAMLVLPASQVDFSRDFDRFLAPSKDPGNKSPGSTKGLRVAMGKRLTGDCNLGRKVSCLFKTRRVRKICMESK